MSSGYSDGDGMDPRFRVDAFEAAQRWDDYAERLLGLVVDALREAATLRGEEPDDAPDVVVAPLSVWWSLNCGPTGLEPLNRDPGEYSACDGSEWYHGERCPQPRPEQSSDT